MTLEEMLAREAIRATMARCARRPATACGARTMPLASRVDGTLQTESASGEVNFRHEGPRDDPRWQNRWKSGSSNADTATSGASFVRHNLTTSQITFTGPDTARVRTYWFVMADNGPDHCGVYTDEFRRSAMTG